jgi:Uma2 family endonuclease
MLMTREPDAQFDALLEDFLALDARTPEGYRAELIDGEIVVTPPPDGDHEDAIGQIVKQVLRNGAVEMDFAATKGLLVPTDGRDDSGHVIPDITFARSELRLFLGAPPWMRPTGVTMVVEVTSSRTSKDREAKRHGYAAARIPLYLLVDREAQRVTLFSEPVRDDYSASRVAAFGDRLHLPAPFGFELSTSAFAR